jgi:integrase
VRLDACVQHLTQRDASNRSADAATTLHPIALERDKIWCERDIATVLAVASSEIQLALILALWSGQRQGDLLHLPWSAYETPYIRLRQSKSGRRVAMLAGEPLRALLDATERRGPLILKHAWPALDVRWVSYVVGEGLRARRHQRPDVS